MSQVIGSAKMDRLGRVRIPASARSRLGWSENTELDLVVDSGGSETIVLRRAEPFCALCGGTDAPLRSFMDTHVCERCRREL